MIDIHPEYIFDNQTNKKAVVIPYAEWEHVLDEIEELNDISPVPANRHTCREAGIHKPGMVTRPCKITRNSHYPHPCVMDSGFQAGMTAMQVLDIDKVFPSGSY